LSKLIATFGGPYNSGVCTDIAIITHKPANVLKRALAQHQQFIQPRALVGVIDNGSNPVVLVADSLQLLRF
jgi:hypothetical protein